VLEVTVIGEPGSQAGATGYGATNLPQLDRVVRERVIEPLDHKNLNAECSDFRSLNPTVENIARAIWRRLDGRFDHCRLFSVKVWETPKTCAEYNGD
jgi:6-pyruvoyltetrahydropterin/6-carboxytetrahydropterin synthase